MKIKMLNLFSSAKKLSIIYIITIVANVNAEELITPQGRIVESKLPQTRILESELPQAGIMSVEKTRNKSSVEQSKLFENNLHKLVKIDPDKVLFMCIEQEYGFRKYFGINTDNGWTCDFILGKGDKFSGPLDDHGSIKYQLTNIGDDSITVRYESEFDHSSFGENKITVDEGTVKLEYR